MIELQDLFAQREALDRQIEELKKEKLADAIKEVQQIIKLYGLTLQDFFDNGRVDAKEKKQRADVVAKYRDPATGKEWSGRGLAPKWIRDQDKTQFLIVAQTSLVPETTDTTNPAAETV